MELKNNMSGKSARGRPKKEINYMEDKEDKINNIINNKISKQANEDALNKWKEKKRLFIYEKICDYLYNKSWPEYHFLWELKGREIDIAVLKTARNSGKTYHVILWILWTMFKFSDSNNIILRKYLVDHEDSTKKVTLALLYWIGIEMRIDSPEGKKWGITADWAYDWEFDWVFRKIDSVLINKHTKQALYFKAINKPLLGLAVIGKWDICHVEEPVQGQDEGEKNDDDVKEGVGFIIGSIIRDARDLVTVYTFNPWDEGHIDHEYYNVAIPVFNEKEYKEKGFIEGTSPDGKIYAMTGHVYHLNHWIKEYRGGRLESDFYDPASRQSYNSIKKQDGYYDNLIRTAPEQADTEVYGLFSPREGGIFMKKHLDTLKEFKLTPRIMHRVEVGYDHGSADDCVATITGFVYIKRDEHAVLVPQGSEIYVLRRLIYWTKPNNTNKINRDFLGKQLVKTLTESEKITLFLKQINHWYTYFNLRGKLNINVDSSEKIIREEMFKQNHELMQKYPDENYNELLILKAIKHKQPQKRMNNSIMNRIKATKTIGAEGRFYLHTSLCKDVKREMSHLVWDGAKEKWDPSKGWQDGIDSMYYSIGRMLAFVQINPLSYEEGLRTKFRIEYKKNRR